MAQILNTWKSEKGKLEYYDIDDKKLIAKNGDYAAYSQWNGSVIYTYKNIAINNLTVYDKNHLDRLAKEERPGFPASSKQLIKNKIHTPLNHDFFHFKISEVG